MALRPGRGISACELHREASNLMPSKDRSRRPGRVVQCKIGAGGNLCQVPVDKRAAPQSPNYMWAASLGFNLNQELQHVVSPIIASSKYECGKHITML